MERRNGKHHLVFFLSWMVFCVQVQSQKGFISIDCGYTDGASYKDTNTGLTYTGDSQVIDSGKNYDVSSNQYSLQYRTLRSFPDNTRNCYKLSPVRRGGKYLIRAGFYYGNYDNKGSVPVFNLHIGVNYWTTVDMGSRANISEIIMVLTGELIHVCLINTGRGTPIISFLELRPLADFMYPLVNELQSLDGSDRWNFGTSSRLRYPDDPYDRAWFGDPNVLLSISSSSPVDVEAGDTFQVPDKVLGTAMSNPSTDSYLPLSTAHGSPGDTVYIVMHFAELLGSTISRVMNIYGGENLTLLFGGYSPPYLRASHKEIKNVILGSSGLYKISINPANSSTWGYMINALESFIVRAMNESQTDEVDVSLMEEIKRDLRLTRNWQGDPCYPRQYSWEGVSCSYDLKPARIISLNLSSSGLVGQLPSSIGQLTALRTFISDWVSKCTSSRNKKKKIIIPVVLAVVITIIILLSIIFLVFKRRKKAHPITGVYRANNSCKEVEIDENHWRTENPTFTYEQIRQITQNFRYEIGKGGFGSVFLGNLGNGVKVAVKVLSSSSLQGIKEFEAEVRLLTRVHHRNLVTLIGYCNDAQNLTLVYEYMDNGTLQDHLKVGGLNWNQRVSVALQAAQGLDYLHNGCRPPIVHRDIKSSNILLNGNLAAKIADFGLSRTFKNDNLTHITTKIAGTPGYLDPWEFHNQGPNEKSDVYSFGVVLLEIITGQPPYVITTQRTHIIQWVSQRVQTGDMRNIVDPRLEGDFDTNAAWKIIKVGMLCTSNKVDERITISNVVVQLKLCVEMVETQDVYDM